MTHRPFALLVRVTRLLRDGWQPWVRPRTPGPGSEEVWARFDEDGHLEIQPLTPPEGELVSDIMHNRVLGNYREMTK